MTPEVFLDLGVSPALRLLPAKMDSTEARAMILAVAFQESQLRRRQQAGEGPAKSYLQFERAGITGVLGHPATKDLARDFCAALDIGFTTRDVYNAIAYCDVLACGLGRLLLWTLPGKLPGRDAPGYAWKTYLEAWRPGIPREATWTANYERAWRLVELPPLRAHDLPQGDVI